MLHDESLEAIDARAEDLVRSHRELMTKLVGFREHHHLTQAEVAERMGVSQSTVSSFERYDSNPTLSTIRRYALAVGVRIRHEFVDDCVAAPVTEGDFRAVFAGDMREWKRTPSQRFSSPAGQPVEVGIYA